MVDESNERQKALENSFETLETRMGELSEKRELQIHSCLTIIWWLLSENLKKLQKKDALHLS